MIKSRIHRRRERESLSIMPLNGIAAPREALWLQKEEALRFTGLDGRPQPPPRWGPAGAPTRGSAPPRSNQVECGRTHPPPRNAPHLRIECVLHVRVQGWVLRRGVQHVFGAISRPVFIWGALSEFAIFIVGRIEVFQSIVIGITENVYFSYDEKICWIINVLCI